MITIRKAAIKDLESIHSLNMKLVSDNYKRYKLKNPKSVEKYIIDYFKKSFRSKNSLFIVAENDSKVIGFIFGRIEKLGKGYKYEKKGYLSHIFVLEKYRKKQVGRKLVKVLFSWFKSNKIKWIRLDVEADNQNAINFWRKIGFKEYMIDMDILLK